MLDGMGEATAAVAPAVAFAVLADPRHASEWFAGADFETPPQGAARAGLEWSFARTPGTRRVQPMRMTVYEPPTRFVWETTFRSPLSTNFIFEMRCEPAEIAADDADSPDATPPPDAAEQPPVDRPSRAAPVQATRLFFTIRLRPSLVQWASIAAGFVLLRRALRERAQTAVDRAAEAALSASSGPASRGGIGRQRGTRPKRRKRR